MSYRITLDMSKKVNKSNVRGWVQHIVRDADARLGNVRNHANKFIDPKRTKDLNSTIVFGADGETMYSEDEATSERALEEFEKRLVNLKRKPRENAHFARGLVFQLPENFRVDYDGEEPQTPVERRKRRKTKDGEQLEQEWHTEGVSEKHYEFFQVCTDWSLDTFGKDVLFASVHLDEQVPQLQVGVTNVSEDGKYLRQDIHWRAGVYEQYRKDLLERLQAAGFDVEFETTERSKERVSNEELSYIESSLVESLDEREGDIKAQEADLVKEREVLNREREALKAERKAFDTDKRNFEVYEMPRLRSKARKDAEDEIEQAKEEARSQGKAEGLASVEAERQRIIDRTNAGARKYLADKRADTDRRAENVMKKARAQGEADLAELRSQYDLEARLYPEFRELTYEVVRDYKQIPLLVRDLPKVARLEPSPELVALHDDVQNERAEIAKAELKAQNQGQKTTTQNKVKSGSPRPS